MLVDCCTKPVNGVQLFHQISFAIGVRFYPHPTLQHFIDLDLSNFSWLYRMQNSTSSLLVVFLDHFILTTKMINNII
jgi:hypothetical protein